MVAGVFAGMMPGMIFKNHSVRAEKGRGRAGVGRFAKIGNSFAQIAMVLTRNRFCDYFLRREP